MRRDNMRGARTMFSLDTGVPVAAISGGTYDGEILCVDPQSWQDKEGALGVDIGFRESILEPILRVEERSVCYIAGPSGSGKTSFCAGLIRRHLIMQPGAKIILFSRTKGENDTAYEGLVEHMQQAIIDDEFVKNPFNCEGLEPGTMLVFDDVGTILDKKQQEAVNLVIKDVLEIGRKLMLWVCVTSHLIIPENKNFARVVMNELQDLVIFPGHSPAQQITYALTKYVGMDKTEIARVRKAANNSRWVQIRCRAPRYVLEETNAYLL